MARRLVNKFIQKYSSPWALQPISVKQQHINSSEVENWGRVP